MKSTSRSLVVIILFAFVVVSCGGGGTSNTRKSNSGGDKLRGQATGYATIFDNDISLARDRAVDDAKSKLVRKKLGEVVTSGSRAENFELVSTFVETKSFGLVKDDRIIKQSRDGNSYTVTIEGTVRAAAINDAIDAAIKAYGRPKFMALVSENLDIGQRNSRKRERNRPGNSITESLIHEVMIDSGFEFVDAGQTQRLIRKEKSKMRYAMKGRINDDVRQLLSDEVNADVLIIGTAETNDQSHLSVFKGTGMTSKSAIVKLKAIDIYTGNIIASVVRDAPGVHINGKTASKRAIKKALNKLLGKYKNRKFKSGPFINQMVKQFVKASTRREIQIIVTGLDYMALKKFRNNLAQRIRGVREVKQKRRSGKAAKLNVYFAGKTEQFTDELMSKAGKMGFKLKITDSRPNKLVMTAELEI